MPVQRPGWGIAVCGSCSVVGLPGGLVFVVCVCLWWFPALFSACLCIPNHHVSLEQCVTKRRTNHRVALYIFVTKRRNRGNRCSSAKNSRKSLNAHPKTQSRPTSADQQHKNGSTRTRPQTAGDDNKHPTRMGAAETKQHTRHPTAQSATKYQHEMTP